MTRTDHADWWVVEPLALTPLLSAALEAFYENGFHGTTVRDIVRRIGQTVPSLYYHHESKEGVFADLLELGTGDVAWRVRAAAADGGDRPADQLANVVEALVLHMTHRIRLAALDLELRHLSAGPRKRYAARRKEIENLLDEVVEGGAAQGVFAVGEPKETARAILGMVQAIARWYHPDGPLRPEEIARRYVGIALNTVGSRVRPESSREPKPHRAHR